MKKGTRTKTKTRTRTSKNKTETRTRAMKEGRKKEIKMTTPIKGLFSVMLKYPSPS